MTYRSAIAFTLTAIGIVVTIAIAASSYITSQVSKAQAKTQENSERISGMEQRIQSIKESVDSNGNKLDILLKQKL